jgi:hypothetical protein
MLAAHYFRRRGTKHVQSQTLGVLHVSHRVVEMSIGRKRLDNILDALKFRSGS